MYECVPFACPRAAAATRPINFIQDSSFTQLFSESVMNKKTHPTRKNYS
jgi:hypothetical protein